MKKKGIFAAVIVLISSAILSGCALLGSLFKTTHTPDEPNNNYNDVVDYYGCPNSKRIKKLNLQKKR